MIGACQATNTYGKEKNSVQKINKSSKEGKVIFNMHGVKMKGFLIRGMFGGQEGGPSPIDQPKKTRKKKLKNIIDHAPMTVSGLIGKGIENVTKVPKYTKDPINP
ncbi:unnamed protein product [Vicia faba]|uniref:Uncharacterized protein n=1 Tax=Vicia faba TaxID=3906 RepID=A0AAV1B9V9_VICFA|nr:unnamed protein product [Vicia faba]